MLPDPEVLPDPLPEPETEPLEVDPEPPVVDPDDDEPEPVPVELEDEPEGVRDRVAPESVAEPEALPEPESIRPVAAPPLREPLSLECEHPANASAPTTMGIAHNLFFIRHLLPFIVAENTNPTIREKTQTT